MHLLDLYLIGKEIQREITLVMKFVKFRWFLLKISAESISSESDIFCFSFIQISIKILMNPKLNYRSIEDYETL